MSIKDTLRSELLNAQHEIDMLLEETEDQDLKELYSNTTEIAMRLARVKASISVIWLNLITVATVKSK